VVDSAVVFNGVYKVSDDVVAREIAGELVLIPISANVGDLESEVYTLNETGHAIWDNLDGVRNLGEITGVLSSIYEASEDGTVGEDVIGLASVLYERGLIVDVSGV
jgi:hypothetical protein